MHLLMRCRKSSKGKWNTWPSNYHIISRFYSENARGGWEMPVKRIRLCYWIARPVKPGVQSSNTSRVRFTVISHTPVPPRFYHIHILYKRNWDGSWLMNLTQKVTRTYIFFKFAICSIALLSLGETCHLKGCDMVTVWWMVLIEAATIVIALVSIMTSRGFNTYCDVAQCMHGLWISITKHESINMIYTPSKQWGVCDNHWKRMNQKISTPEISLWSRFFFPDSNNQIY